jgi:general stress protein 26
MQLIEKLNELISGIEIAMMCSVHPAGHLHSRPMATQAITNDGYLWFFTSAHSSKIDEVRNGGRQVNLAYADPVGMRFVSISGPCELVRNQAIAAELWRDEYTRWFPQGLNDPDLILLKVTVDSAEYWDAQAKGMRRLAPENQTIIYRDDRTVA